jgi:hypothetical protein
MSRETAELDELHANTLGETPSDSTIALHKLWLDQQRKLVWDANSTLDFECRASLRHISDDAVDGRRNSKNDGATLIGSEPRTSAVF